MIINPVRNKNHDVDDVDQVYVDDLVKKIIYETFNV